jgi:archaellum component FlaC
VFEYDSYEQILHKKFNAAKKNIKARLKNKGLPTHDSFGWESVDHAVQWGMELLEQMDYRCPRTHNRLSKISNKYQVSLDRVDSDLGYTPDNVELVTSEYNIFKMDRTPHQVLSMCERVLRANMGNNIKHKSLINQLDNSIAELEMLKNSFGKQLDHYKNKLDENI